VLSLAALAQQLQQFSLNATAECSDACSKHIAAKPHCRGGHGTVQNGKQLSDEKF